MIGTDPNHIHHGVYKVERIYFEIYYELIYADDKTYNGSSKQNEIKKTRVNLKPVHYRHRETRRSVFKVGYKDLLVVS
jgi:hypothetical protein